MLFFVVGFLGVIPFVVPYEVDGKRERLVYLSREGDLAAYEELRAGFTAAVSHELRTPLARLLTLLETAELPGEDVGELVEHVVSRLPPGHHAHCPRCGTALHQRKPDSIGRTWALLITGYVLFIPANILPITVTSSIVGVQSDTIMSGVIHLWNEAAYPLSIVILVASIGVPPITA